MIFRRIPGIAPEDILVFNNYVNNQKGMRISCMDTCALQSAEAINKFCRSGRHAFFHAIKSRQERFLAKNNIPQR